MVIHRFEIHKDMSSTFREIRKSFHMSREEFSQLVGWKSVTSVKHFEEGIQQPTIRTLFKVKEKFLQKMSVHIEFIL